MLKQATLKAAQERADKLADRENLIAVNSLSIALKKRQKHDAVKEPNLEVLFEEEPTSETSTTKQPDKKTRRERRGQRQHS